MKKFLPFFLFLFAPLAQGQSTSVSATVTDTVGTPYVSGTLTVTLINTSGQQALFGGNANFQKNYNAQLDQTGSFTISLPSNTALVPSGTQWGFNICASDGGSCFGSSVTITGTSQSISATLSAASPRITFTVGSKNQPSCGAGQMIVAVGTLFGCGVASTATTATNLTGPGAITGTFSGNPVLTGSPTINTLNNAIHVGGSTGLTLAQGLAACPITSAGCYIAVDGPLTFTAQAAWTQTGIPIEIECLVPSGVNSNSTGTLLTYSPAAFSTTGIDAALYFKNAARVVIKNCNVTQGNATKGPSVALTNVVGNGTLATANCTAACTFFVGQVVQITGNANAGYNCTAAACANGLAAVTAVTGTSFSFNSPVNATGAGGSAQAGVDGIYCQGCQGSDFENVQSFGFTGAACHVSDDTGSSGEYNNGFGLQCNSSLIGMALTQVYAAKTVSQNTFIGNTKIVSNTVIELQTTGTASENTFIGEISDPGATVLKLVQLGDGVTSCRENDAYNFTMETAANAVTGVDNRCAGSWWKGEFGLSGTTPVHITDANGPASTSHDMFKAAGTANPAGCPSNVPYTERTTGSFKWDCNGNIGLGGANPLAGANPSINGITALAVGGNTILTIAGAGAGINGARSFTLGAGGTFVPSAAGANDLGTTALPFGNLWLGTAATNNFKFQPAATAASRIIQINDPGGTSALLLGGTNLLISPTAPTIAAGGCGGAAASIPNNNGTAAFEINVGTTPTSACTVTLPTAAHNWTCFATDVTTNSTSVFLQKQTGGSTTTAVITNFSDVAAATAFTASDVLRVSCHAY